MKKMIFIGTAVIGIGVIALATIVGFLRHPKSNTDIDHYRSCQLACAKQVTNCFEDVETAWGDKENAAGPRNYCKIFVPKCQVDCTHWGDDKRA